MADPVPINILIIDDDQGIRTSLVRHFNNHVIPGNRILKTDTAASPAEARHKLDNSGVAFDVITVDFNMKTSVNGPQLIRQLREVEKFKNLFIVGFSGTDGVEKLFLEAGANHYLDKMHADELFGLIEIRFPAPPQPPIEPAGMG